MPIKKTTKTKQPDLKAWWNYICKLLEWYFTAKKKATQKDAGGNPTPPPPPPPGGGG